MFHLDKEEDLRLNGLVVVKFSAEWCAPCKRMQSLLIKMEKEFPEIKFFDVDVDKLDGLAKKYRIMSLPTLLLFSGDKQVDKIVGVVLTDQLRKSLKSLAGK